MTDLFALPTAGDDPSPRAFLQTPSREGIGAQASPDGKWVAYQSNKSGRYEIYVAPYPADPERERQVSISGGSTPRWGPGGRELCYYEPARGELLLVPLTYGANDVRVGNSKPLFKVRRPEKLGGVVRRDGGRKTVPRTYSRRSGNAGAPETHRELAREGGARGVTISRRPPSAQLTGRVARGG